MTAPVLVPGPAPAPALPQEAPASGAAARSSRVVAWACVLGAVALVAAALVGSVRGVDTASLRTTLTAVSEGTTVDGELAEPGQTVPAGAEVRTARPGTRLTTGERTVELAAGTAVTVLDGARQRLSEGQLLVETVGAPLLVEGDVAEVHVREDAQVRVEHRRPYLHVMSYDQDAEAESAELRAPGRPSGRVLQGLHEIVLARGVLPGQARPLALRGEDDWERLMLADVVRADQRLRALADQLAVGERGDLVVARASLTEAAPGPRRGEVALARALAQRDDGHDRALERAVHRLRGEGGSWGVVARLTQTSPDTAQAWLSSLAPATLAAPAGDMSALVAALTGAGGTAVGGPAGSGGAPAPADAPGTGTPPAGSAPEAPRPPAEPAPAPVPVPTPSAGPLDDLVDAVLDLLPDVAATTAPVPAGTAPAPAGGAPADGGFVDSVGGTVGGVVGGVTRGVTESLTGTAPGNGRGKAHGHDRKAAESDEPAAAPAGAPVQDAVEGVSGVVDVLLPPGLAKKQAPEAGVTPEQEPLTGLSAGS